jgi:glycosyltransferase involved in cell wall biosynthesis
MEHFVDRPKVTVLVCTLNEEECLPHVLPRIPGWVHEVLLIDGGSTDRTVEVAQKLSPDIRILFQAGKGKGNAIKHGVRTSTGDIIVALDADGETDPADIKRFVEPLLRGADFVKGSRLARGRPANMSFHRWVGNRILAWTCNALHGTRYTDVCSGYNGFWKRAFLGLELTLDSFEMEQEMLVKAAKAGRKVVEVFHQDNGRIGGVSKISDVRQGLIDWWIIVRERFRRW